MKEFCERTSLVAYILHSVGTTFLSAIRWDRLSVGHSQVRLESLTYRVWRPEGRSHNLANGFSPAPLNILASFFCSS